MAGCSQGVCPLTEIRTQGTRKQVMLGLGLTLRSGEEKSRQDDIRENKGGKAGMWASLYFGVF